MPEASSVIYTSKEEWQREVLKVRSLGINEQEYVIDLVSKLFYVKPVYILFKNKARLCISFIALTKGNKIIVPIHFFYSAFWIDSTLSDTKYCECLTEFLEQLQKNYSEVNLRLPIEITDIRPFLWKDFSIDNRYTYIKDLSNSLSYNSSTSKNIKRILSKNYVCVEEELDEKSLQLNMQMFKDLKIFHHKKRESISKLMKGLAVRQKLMSYNCYLNNKMIASNIILLDLDNKVAYTLLLNKIEKEIKDDVHSLLHHFFFTILKERQFKSVDLLGGDIQSIAAFKSRFNTSLKRHYIVKYRKRDKLVKHALLGVKQFLARIISNF